MPGPDRRPQGLFSGCEFTRHPDDVVQLRGRYGQNTAAVGEYPVSGRDPARADRDWFTPGHLDGPPACGPRRDPARVYREAELRGLVDVAQCTVNHDAADPVAHGG